MAASPSPREQSVNGTILVYGNDEMLVTTRQLTLGKAGYQVFSATNFFPPPLRFFKSDALANNQAETLNEKIHLRGWTFSSLRQAIQLSPAGSLPAMTLSHNGRLLYQMPSGE
jgi:hypothetical protein